MKADQRDEEPILFRESQHFGQLWLVALVLVVAAIGVSWIVAVAAGEADSAAGAVGGLVLGGVVALGLPIALAVMRLVTLVGPNGLHVRLAPFQPRGRRVAWEALASFRAVTYRPVREYGGWGIRGYGKRVAYNARGDRGVLLTFRDGATLLVGSQQPQRLEAAIAQATGRAPERVAGAPSPADSPDAPPADSPDPPPAG